MASIAIKPFGAGGEDQAVGPGERLTAADLLVVFIAGGAGLPPRPSLEVHQK
jgi:hypothetical protein